ncbi:hypothetical protein B0H15DRAFT_1020179 [Mycena belliarum]|uniref:HMG box domain-containing protein n=1 Tax=Mycena belliarum TaxID=1033014 RepID=A0AAD6UBP4_9AGAR|nr:hypothetical protein B0H15DRAFT_1020179 [Mycena belliae]
MNSYAQIKLEELAATPQSEYRFPSAPSSDSGFTSASDWSGFSSPALSPTSIPLPHVRLARSVRGTERQRAKDEHDAVASSPFASYYRPQTQLPSAPTSSSVVKSKARRIPRPPNAFILYRSSLLNSIPDDIERRQQTLSRVAGQAWNLLKPHEKRVWQERAAERAAIHQREYPDYHFKPSPRGKGKAKGRSDANKSEDAISALREKYLGISGPPACLPRQRKRKAPAEEDQFNDGILHVSPSTPSDIASSGVSSPAVSPTDAPHLVAYDWTPFPTSDTSAPSLPSPEPASDHTPLPPCFPQRTFPHITAPRRPSTSLGFIRRLDEDTSCFESGFALERPASAASDTGLATLVRDLDLTPTAANFGPIPMPSPPKFHSLTGEHIDALQSPFPLQSTFPFGAFGQWAPFPESAIGSGDVDRPSTNDQSTFSDAQFMMALDESYGFNPNGSSAFSLDDGWTFA